MRECYSIPLVLTLVMFGGNRVLRRRENNALLLQAVHDDAP
jgi:hypothetical protein